MKKIVAILLMLALLIMSCARGEVAAPKQRQLLVAGSSAASSWHMQAIALCHLWNTYVPEVNCTPVEAKGSVENAIGLEDGRFQISPIVSTDKSVAKTMRKLEPFQDRKVVNTWRNLLKSALPEIAPIYVRADSDIKTMSDLNGRKFAPSARGAGTSFEILAAMEVLGIKPDYFWGSHEECATALKERKIEAYNKTAPGYAMDAVIIDILTKQKLRMLSFTEEEAKKINESGKLVMAIKEVPAGAYKGFPDHPAIRTFGGVAGAGPSTLKGVLSDELGYKLVKALVEHWEDLYVVWPTSKQIVEEVGGPIKNTIEDTLFDNEFFNPEFHKFFPGESVHPLHPGAVKYFKEKGYDVPALIIPPEYKE